MAITDKDLINLYDEYSKCKTVQGRTEVRIKIKNRLNFLKIDRNNMNQEEILKDIIKDLANNDYESLEIYLKNKFSANSENEIYLGKANADMLSSYITQGRSDVLQRMIQILEKSAESIFDKDVDCIPFIMYELLPDRLGVELLVYKKPE